MGASIYHHNTNSAAIAVYVPHSELTDNEDYNFGWFEHYVSNCAEIASPNSNFNLAYVKYTDNYTVIVLELDEDEVCDLLHEGFPLITPEEIIASFQKFVIEFFREFNMRFDLSGAYFYGTQYILGETFSNYITETNEINTGLIKHITLSNLFENLKREIEFVRLAKSLQLDVIKHYSPRHGYIAAIKTNEIYDTMVNIGTRFGRPEYDFLEDEELILYPEVRL